MTKPYLNLNRSLIAIKSSLTSFKLGMLPYSIRKMSPACQMFLGFDSLSSIDAKFLSFPFSDVHTRIRPFCIFTTKLSSPSSSFLNSLSSSVGFCFVFLGSSKIRSFGFLAFRLCFQVKTPNASSAAQHTKNTTAIPFTLNPLRLCHV